jgi:hypothetical protein
VFDVKLLPGEGQLLCGTDIAAGQRHEASMCSLPACFLELHGEILSQQQMRPLSRGHVKQHCSPGCPIISMDSSCSTSNTPASAHVLLPTERGDAGWCARRRGSIPGQG